MKPRLFPLFLVLIISISSMLTYESFVRYQQPVQASEDDSAVVIPLPDQEYIISRRDLDQLDGELIIPQKNDGTPKVTYNPDIGELETLTSPQDYVVDVAELKSGTLAYTLRNRYSESIDKYNERLRKIYESPLNISLKDGSSLAQLSLDANILKSILKPTSTELNAPPLINQSSLLSYITTHLTAKQKQYFNGEVAYHNTQNAINLRFLGENTPVVMGVDDGPSSSGELSDRYLEIDLSQQKMYFFINHTLYKEYKISTGADYPTPVGEFHILNKAPIAYSDIYNVWMPYWMGFTYARDVGAYLGIHEIAYALDPKGKPFYKHGYYIGDMFTGGCVAMEPKDSREIYNLSDVGMLVRIVK